MANNRLGMHWIRSHPDNARDFDFIRSVRPASVKVFEWMWSNWDFCRELAMALPEDCIILARDHPMSEQKADMWKDPVGTGARHAREWHEKVQRGQYLLPTGSTYFLGINEPDTEGDRAAIDAYTVAFLDGLRSCGLKGGAFNFSTGHPRTHNGKPDGVPDYSFFEASHQAIVRGQHIAVQHIYGTAAEPCVPGHFDRLRSCKWQDVQWVIGECGIDEHVIGGGEHHGYLIALHPPSAYPQWLEQLIRGTGDPHIHSWQPFTFDFSHPWGSFDVREVNHAFAAWAWQGADFAPAPPPEDTQVYMPIVETGGSVSQPEPQVISGIVDPLVLEAILQIESGGRAVGEQGYPIIRFEAHILKQQLGDDATWAGRFRHGSPQWTGQEMCIDGVWQPIHTGAQTSEWQAYDIAAQLNAEAAARSISMGAAQIMGFNHARIGYPSAQAQLRAFRSASVQVIGFINFLMSDSTLWAAVRAHDWRTIARLYNGAGAVETYAPLLEAKYNELKTARGN